MCQHLSLSPLKSSAPQTYTISLSHREKREMWRESRGRIERSPAADTEITTLISPVHYSLQIFVYPSYIHLPVQTIKRPAHKEVSEYKCQRIHDHITIYLISLHHNGFKTPRIPRPLLRLSRVIASIGLVIMHDLGQQMEGKAGKTNRSDINPPCVDLYESLPCRKHSKSELLLLAHGKDICT